MSFRAFATLLCGCLIVLAAATSTVSAQVSAQPFTCNFNEKTKTCGGTCPKGLACTQLPGSKDCKCQEPSNKCKFNEKTKICGGTCPEGQACTLLPGTKACECKPPPPPCGYNEKTKTCGGACPKGKTCKPGPVKTKCGCY